jgi:hypothetical protein
VTPDFFPLRAGRVLEYETRDADGRGSVLVEVLSVDARLGRVEARCRRTAGGRSGEFLAVVDADAARTDGDVEFPLPGVVGQAWTRHPRRYEIESLSGIVDTPSGRYENCIVVRYLIAGGDAGFGRRYYAPDVGFVHEACADEADPFQISLARVQEPRP